MLDNDLHANFFVTSLFRSSFSEYPRVKSVTNDGGLGRLCGTTAVLVGDDRCVVAGRLKLME